MKNHLLVLILLLLPSVSFAQDAAAGKEKAAVCAACHGADGNSTIPQNPILAGQTARYIYLQLRDFKEGRRKDPIMSPMAANLSKKDMLDLGAREAAVARLCDTMDIICVAAPDYLTNITTPGLGMRARSSASARTTGKSPVKRLVSTSNARSV